MVKNVCKINLLGSCNEENDGIKAEFADESAEEKPKKTGIKALNFLFSLQSLDILM